MESVGQTEGNESSSKKGSKNISTNGVLEHIEKGEGNELSSEKSFQNIATNGVLEHIEKGEGNELSSEKSFQNIATNGVLGHIEKGEGNGLSSEKSFQNIATNGVLGHIEKGEGNELSSEKSFQNIATNGVLGHIEKGEGNELSSEKSFQNISTNGVLEHIEKGEGNELSSEKSSQNIATNGVLEPFKKGEGNEFNEKNVSYLEPLENERSLKSTNLSSSREGLTLVSKTTSYKMFKTNDILISEQTSKTPTPDLLSTIIISRVENNDMHSKSKSSMLSKIEGENKGLAIVKFCIQTKTVVASAFKLSETAKYIKHCFADVLELDESLFYLDIDGNEVNEMLTLADFGLKPLEKITFYVRSATGKRGQNIIVNKVDKNIPTLTVITVHSNVGGILKDIIVEIEDQCCEKEWQGGFRNILTNVEYHNVQVQTLPKQRETVKYTETGREYLLFHRDTQTPIKPKDTVLDTVNNKATQMSKSNLFIPSKTDRILVSKPYVDFEQLRLNNNIEKSVIIIQRAVRRWMHGKKLKEIIRLQRNLLEDMKRQKAQILKEQADNERIVMTGAANPVKRDDFYMLYLMVGNWWKREWKRINETRSKETKQAEVVALLLKHVDLLREIEKHKTIGKKEAMKKERMRFIDMMARPITFKNSKGKMTSIDDIKTQRAREFKEIYSAIIRTDVPPKDRIEVLFVLGNVIRNHYMDYEYANDLISLIEREINLLTAGFKVADLKGLHLRIEQLLMNFLENKECNPKAAYYTKPNAPKTFHIQFQCSRCKKLLPVSKFPVHVRMKRYHEGGCKSCTWMHNIGHQRVDMSPFFKLLKQVQNEEMEKCCYSAVCFILQPIGMGFITMKIWHGHSAISESRDISKLQHVRWLKDVEWAPWNTILLTNQEAKLHMSIPNVFEFYDQSFVNSVQQKHILARSLLQPLLVMDHDICSSGVWASIKDEGVFLHPSHAEVFSEGNEYDTV